MKYNVVKLRDGKVIEFVCRGVEANEAEFTLDCYHEAELSRMFQDVDPIISDDNCHSFNCYRSGATITYQIEIDNFHMFNILKPRKYQGLPEFLQN